MWGGQLTVDSATSEKQREWDIGGDDVGEIGNRKTVLKKWSKSLKIQKDKYIDRLT